MAIWASQQRLDHTGTHSLALLHNRQPTFLLPAASLGQKIKRLLKRIAMALWEDYFTLSAHQTHIRTDTHTHTVTQTQVRSHTHASVIPLAETDATSDPHLPRVCVSVSSQALSCLYSGITIHFVFLKKGSHTNLLVNIHWCHCQVLNPKTMFSGIFPLTK